jgi:ribonucleoside-triphosphate reductase (thioredoxin)
MTSRLPTIYQDYIHISRYARYRDELGRRETWDETVGRYIDHFKKFTGDNKKIPWEELRQGILNLEVMPSMRALMTAGPALEKDQVAGYNCSYAVIDNPKVFDEIMYILMCGTGVGYSVESRYTNKLPEIPDEIHPTETTIVVRDSKIGWATAYREFISLLYSGKLARYDVSKVRKAGERLKTFGGRASGPEPLVDLFEFTRKIFEKARGRKLTTLECSDIVCKIADIVVVGGVRRSALICLSDLNDDYLRNAKSGQWWNTDGHRQLANISAVYERTPSMETFVREWIALYNSKSGERGIFSRKASQVVAAKYGRRDETVDYGTNPCSEIILRPDQFCNLSEVVVRDTDTQETLLRKVRLATILGTLQATQTNFRYISKRWKNNTEEEALLGVSLTGIMDNALTSNQVFSDVDGFSLLPALLAALREEAVKVNKQFAKILEINPAAAITCVKPSGTVSQLVDSASGIHPRYAPYYIRRVRGDKKDPLAEFMFSHGYEAEEDFYGSARWVFGFPMKASHDAICVKDVNAIKQLELWKVYQEHWCEHKPSITVYVNEDEWMEVGAWVYKNIDALSGVSFLPSDTGSYRQAPYEEITEEKYNELVAKQNLSIDWTEFKELTDNTESAKTLACVAGVCEI